MFWPPRVTPAVQRKYCGYENEGGDRLKGEGNSLDCSEIVAPKRSWSDVFQGRAERGYLTRFVSSQESMSDFLKRTRRSNLNHGNSLRLINRWSVVPFIFKYCMTSCRVIKISSAIASGILSNFYARSKKTLDNGYLKVYKASQGYIRIG